MTELPAIYSTLCTLSISAPAIKQASESLIFISTHKLSLQYPLLSIKCHVTLRITSTVAYFSIPLYLIGQRAHLSLTALTTDRGSQAPLKCSTALLKSEVPLGIAHLSPLIIYSPIKGLLLST